MTPNSAHTWPTDYHSAVALQNRLRGRIIIQPLKPGIRIVAGVDVSYDEHGGLMHAGVVVIRLPRFELLETTSASLPVTFPYVPGLLTFREAPAVLEAFAKLDARPQAVIADGQGVAHMRGIGLASHLGLLLGVPTVGCAKSRLVGEHRELVHLLRGRRTPLRYEGRTVGSVLCTRDHVKPVYVSPGHLSDITTSVRLVLRCCGGFRLPDPIRAAHALVTRLRRSAGPA